MKAPLIRRKELPAWAWLWGPLGLVLLSYALAVNVRLEAFSQGEMGIIENATVLILLVGIVGGFLGLRTQASGSTRWLRWWIVLIAAGSLYFAGEELSWGQHFVGWSTPETWRQLNHQDETNLHNINGLLDKLPRNALTLAALVGGIIVPVFARRRRIRFDPNRPASWIWPTSVCVPTCLLAITVTLPEKIAKTMNVDIPHVLDNHPSEAKECLLATFMTLYLWSLYRRLRQSGGGGEAEATVKLRKAA